MIKTDDDCLHQANYQEFHDYGDCFQRGIHHNFGDVGTAYFLFFCFAICAWGLFDLIPPKHPRSDWNKQTFVAWSGAFLIICDYAVTKDMNAISNGLFVLYLFVLIPYLYIGRWHYKHNEPIGKPTFSKFTGNAFFYPAWLMAANTLYDEPPKEVREKQLAEEKRATLKAASEAEYEVAADAFNHELRRKLGVAEHDSDVLAIVECCLEEQYKQEYFAVKPEERAGFNDKVIPVLVRACAAFLNALPKFVARRSSLSAPFASIITNLDPFDAFMRMIGRENVFPSATKQYSDNHTEVKESVDAGLVEKGSQTYFQNMIWHTPFSDALVFHVPIALPQQERFEGTWIVAPPGRGKTTLLSALLNADLGAVANGKASIIIMDSKGDLINHVRRLARFAPGGDLEGKLTLIEPSETLAINPLDLGIDHVAYVISSIMGNTISPQQITLLKMLALVCEKVPNATLSTLRQLLSEWEPYQQYMGQLDQEDRDFFLKEYGSTHYKDTKQALLARIRGLEVSVSLMRPMFRAPRTLIDLGKEMDAGKVIVIDNSVDTLKDGSEFFSRFFIALVLKAAQQRASRNNDDKLPCYFYIDECDTVIGNDLTINTILSKCRSQKIGMILAHQKIADIKVPQVKAALADCAIRIANPDEEASELADRFRTTTEFIRSIPRGQFAFFVRDSLKKPIVLTVPNTPVSDDKAWPKMQDSQLAAIRHQMRERYCYTPTPTPQFNPETAPDPNDVPTGPQKLN